ncbi:hypothetical protein B9Z55_020619 [Caenorhabditis nigoni]|uniref:Uncharacterized protein n=1 Tax=Caenorhabditis nigoni TaxID=1611254 RepID=A0A2G5TP03_9PELO|nr:hypothetical protein B9Z55_020618 [Caenorhabditis nigoni]PIC28821.1 hypothetical protein B9Z55_020619 [Caenorhabditis nigoni]
MLWTLKFLLVCLAVRPMILIDAPLPLYTAFATVPQPSQTTMHKNLGYYASATKKLFIFDPADPSIDFKSLNWMDPCYLDFYASNADFVVFWLVDGIGYCESVKLADGENLQRYPAKNLMRVERLGVRCPADAKP